MISIKCSECGGEFDHTPTIEKDADRYFLICDGCGAFKKVHLKEVEDK